MLPYTGLHAMLFDAISETALIMTSANPPNEPIIIENNKALDKLRMDVDYFLLHNRAIANRCDDSVLRFHKKNPCLIRRSRGYAPEPIKTKFYSNYCVLGVGGELNVTICLLINDRAFISQHLGNMNKLDNLQFLKETINHLIRLTNGKIDLVACDLHPNFSTTRLAKQLGNKFNCPVIPVQHHHAHAAALMGEWNLNEIINVTCDGYGYGSDKTAWGGEVLYCNREGFTRAAHLEKQPMIGGDLATYFPIRMTAGILNKKMNIGEWIVSKRAHLPHGALEAEIIQKQIETRKIEQTTSCGRILDAVSALLGVCYERTYEGEPAMKLESAAVSGKECLDLIPRINGSVLNTTYLVYEIFRNLENFSINDLALTAQLYLARGLGKLAVKEANKAGINNIGFSGGVAYNEKITNTIQEIIENEGLNFWVHKKIPTGDGGTSFGQAIVAGLG
jgi:hydrogenase maturation protein HypF